MMETAVTFRDLKRYRMHVCDLMVEQDDIPHGASQFVSHRALCRGIPIRVPASVNEEHDGPRPGAASVGGSPDVEVQAIFAEGTLKGSPCRCDVGVVPDDNVSLHIF